MPTLPLPYCSGASARRVGDWDYIYIIVIQLKVSSMRRTGGLTPSAMMTVSLLRYNLRSPGG